MISSQASPRIPQELYRPSNTIPLGISSHADNYAITTREILSQRRAATRILRPERRVRPVVQSKRKLPRYVSSIKRELNGYGLNAGEAFRRYRRKGGGSSSSSRSKPRRFYWPRWAVAATKGLVRDVWGFKEWFPAAHHSSPPVKSSARPPPSALRPPPSGRSLPSSFYRPCLHRARMDLFREELPRRVRVREERSLRRGR